MAEPLGTAELILTVNDEALRQGLADARKLVNSLESDTKRTTTRARRGQSGSGGGRGGGGADGLNRRSTGGSVRQVGSPAFSARGASAGGPKEETRALEKAQERRFRLSQRIESLEERGADVTRLRARLGQLTEAQSNRQFGTFRQISQELARQVTLAERRVRLAEQARRLEQRDARVGAKQGGARESINAVTDAQKRRYRLDQQIRSLEAGGVKTDKLRAQLGEATTAQSRRQFGTFNQIADALDFTLRKERDRLKVSREQSRELERQATEGRRIGRLNASPVRGGIAFPGSPGAEAAEQAEGRRIGRLNALPVQGGKNIPGSPAAKAAQRRADEKDERDRRKAFREEQAEGRRLGRLNSSPIRGGRAFPESPAANEAIVSRNLQVRSSWVKALDFLDDTADLIARKAAEKADKENRRIGGLNALPVQGGKEIPGSPAAKAAKRRADEKDERERRKAFREEQAEGRRIGRLNASSFSNASIPGSPAFLARQKREDDKAARAAKRSADARSKKTNDIVGSAIIGGAFPLLFGQGAGASIGGALGGGIGGAIGGQFGFGLSLVGTAVGAQIDVLAARLGDLGKALQDPIANFEVFIQQATLASKAQEGLAQALKDSGQNAAASELIRKEASQFADPVAVQNLTSAQDEFARSLSDVQDLLGSIVAGSASGFLDFLSSVLKLVAGSPKTNSLTGPDAVKNAQNRGLAGLGAVVGGLSLGIVGGAALATGAGAPVGLGLIASGASIAGAGAFGIGSSQGDARVATSKDVVAAEAAVTAAVERQLKLEKQILQANAENKTGLADQLTLQAQFNDLRGQELKGISAIRQETARNQDGVNDPEDRAKALKQEQDLKKAIDLRRQALLSAATAAATASGKELSNARQLVGKYGSEREILETQLEIKKATNEAEQAQEAYNEARQAAAKGGNNKELLAAEQLLTTAVNKRIKTELEGSEKIRKIRADLAANAQLQNNLGQIRGESLDSQIANTRLLRGTPEGPRRSAAQAGQAALFAVDEARRRERAIGAQIDAARQRGDESALPGLVAEQRNAAKETQLALETGALSIVEAGAKLREDAKTAQNALRSALEGSFDLLRRPEQQRLVFQARSDIARAGVFDPSKVARLSERELLSAAASANSIVEAQRNLTDIQSATVGLSEVNRTLNTQIEANTTAVGNLATFTETLANKNWNVNVTVSGAQSAVYGDVVNGALSP